MHSTFRHLLLLVLLTSGLAVANAASAQPADAADPAGQAGASGVRGIRGIRFDGSGQPYRPWDFTVSTGFQFDDDAHDWVPATFSGGSWDGAWGLQFDLGHYWTSHLKTEASAALLTNRRHYGYEELVVNGRPAQASWYGDARRGYVSGAVTWQFLDNAFAHPFVSAGVRLNVVDLHRRREGYAWSWIGGPSTSFPIEPIDERKTLLQARPYVAAGYKSYFYNERTFLRSELSLGAGPHGVSQWGLRIGVGFDF